MSSKTFQVLIFSIVFALVFSWLVHFSTHNIGISANDLEADARQASSIGEDWLVCTGTAEDMAAMLFYSPDRSDYSIQIYVTHSGLSKGYFFRYGGSEHLAVEGIVKMTLEGNPCDAFLSMNRSGVCRLEVDDGTTTLSYHLDPDTPFAVVLPVNCGSVTFYDPAGNAVNYLSRAM